MRFSNKGGESAASIVVHLYVGGPAGSGAPIYGLRANRSNEPAVSSVCGGGEAHRYRFAIPNWQARRGQPVYAYGINVGGGRNAQLKGAPLAVR